MDEIKINNIDVVDCPMHRVYFRTVLCEGGNKGVIKAYSYECTNNPECMFKQLQKLKKENEKLKKENEKLCKK